MKLQKTVRDKNPVIHSAGPCLNCGTHLWPKDLFCPHCGQKRLEHDEMSFNHMARESFLDYFHMDSKLFGTIGPLLFRPGFLTSEFMKGKRKTYVEPFKLFLVISVIYFLLLPLGGDSTQKTSKAVNKPSTPSAVKKTKEQPIAFQYDGIQMNLTQQDSLRNAIEKVGINVFVEKEHGQSGWLTKLLMKQVYKIVLYSGKSFWTVVERTASKMIFLLIPVFALLLKLMYRKKGRLYFEHLIFSMHFHAFFFLLMTIVLLIEMLVPVSISITFLLSVIYLFLAMKKFYGEGGGKTFRKFLLQLLMYCLIGLPVFFILLILVAVILY